MSECMGLRLRLIMSSVVQAFREARLHTKLMKVDKMRSELVILLGEQNNNKTSYKCICKHSSQRIQVVSWCRASVADTEFYFSNLCIYRLKTKITLQLSHSFL
mmetsp:Transcript_34058/g.82482  ORF Transcript_34058/g.82482 Transcript_34058/m.82482 type:complete len:103 (-) Transcript_34058:825-1133(-)